MGNIFQDFIIYIGLIYRIPDFIHLTTYNYYALFEDWAIKNKKMYMILETILNILIF